jgi:uncharacterized protein (DUF1499 family)
VLLKIAAGAAVLVLLAAAGVFAWARLAPLEPEQRHVDPLTVEKPDVPHATLAAPQGAAASPTDITPPVWDATPQALMRAFDDLALSRPRTQRIAGSVEDLHATYVQRTAFWGFPDYISVRALAAPEGGATLAVYSRARYGYEDFGVNAARVSSWLESLEP